MKTHLCCPENSGFQVKKGRALSGYCGFAARPAQADYFILFLGGTQTASAHAQNRLCHKEILW